MKIAASILDCKDRVNGVLELNKTNISYIHIDVMDGKFVSNVEFDNIDEIKGINTVTKYPMDVHLMVDNPLDYINQLGNMNIEFITIHLEIDKDKKDIFKNIRELGYKVGLSIKPNTSIKEIESYLDDIDMVLVMSVEPGLGGQSFINSTVDRIKELKELIGNRNILIEVDGGINNETIVKLDGVDIAVVGSYITKSDNYNNRVEELLNLKDFSEHNISDIDSNMRIGELLKKQVLSEVDLHPLDLKEINRKKILYKALLVLGVVPYFLLISYGVDAYMDGYSFLWGSKTYGWEGFFLQVRFLFMIFWPIFLIGLILIIVGIINLRKLKRLTK